MRPADERAQSPEQQGRLLRELLASTQRAPTAAEQRAHTRKARVLVSLEMLGPVSDEELEERVRVALAGAPGITTAHVEVIQP